VIVHSVFDGGDGVGGRFVVPIIHEPVLPARKAEVRCSRPTFEQCNVGNGEVGDHLSAGHSVVGIAASIATLPKALVVAADASVEIKLDANILADAVARFVGSKSVFAETVDGLRSLDFHDLVSAFRAGSTSAEIYSRLRTSVAHLGRPRGDRLPRLVDAVEYGSAREWGLTLCRDFEEYRAGRIAWSDVSAHAHCVFAGATGVGKTFFARILANELGIPLIATSISEIFATSSTGYLDSIIKQVREVFAAGVPHAILWDEYDALPSRATLVDGRSSSFWTPVVSEFLLALDSAVSGERAGQCVWAATNYPERIDAALLRPGRLDRVIHFTAPGPDGIASILRHHLGPDLPGVDLTPLGQIAIGRSHAEVAAVIKQARSAARRARRPLQYGDLFDAIAPRADLDEPTLRRVALHESGHAVVALALGVDEVVAAAVGGAGEGFGRTLMRRRDGVETRTSIENRVSRRTRRILSDAFFQP
jgi:cell division protease FtsH